MKHTPGNCNTCDLGKELKNDERFKQLPVKICHKCSEFLIMWKGGKEVNCIAIDDRNYDSDGNIIPEKEKIEEKDEPDYRRVIC